MRATAYFTTTNHDCVVVSDVKPDTIAPDPVHPNVMLVETTDYRELVHVPNAVSWYIGYTYEETVWNTK